MVLQFLRRRPQEQLAHEQIVPGVFVHDANRQTVGGIGSAEKILHKKLAPAQMFHHSRIESVKFLRLKRGIDRAPGDGVRGGFVLHDELVFGRAAGAIGIADEGAIGGQLGFIPPDRVLDQQCRGKIEVRPAFAQQLGYVADVHGRSHKGLLD